MALPMIYVASKLIHAEMWKNLRQAGINIVSTWIDSGRPENDDAARRILKACEEEIAKSAFLVLYCRKGEVLRDALVECGIALALGKEIRQVGECESVGLFAFHPMWKKCQSLAQAVGLNIVKRG